mmetsp:Transcript_9776/g.13437  ORF Transcript_9776/g.13437 Transcript_9776/m.13437 type:complete len:274 (-) Transcript_9776:358-1179(-)
MLIRLSGPRGAEVGDHPGYLQVRKLLRQVSGHEEELGGIETRGRLSSSHSCATVLLELPHDVGDLVLQLPDILHDEGRDHELDHKHHDGADEQRLRQQPQQEGLQPRVLPELRLLQREEEDVEQHPCIGDEHEQVADQLLPDRHRSSGRLVSGSFGGEDLAADAREQVALKQKQEVLGLGSVSDCSRLHGRPFLANLLRHFVQLEENYVAHIWNLGLKVCPTGILLQQRLLLTTRAFQKVPILVQTPQTIKFTPLIQFQRFPVPFNSGSKRRK